MSGGGTKTATGGSFGTAMGAQTKKWGPYILASIAAGAALQGINIMIDKIIDHVQAHGHKAQSKEYYVKMLEAHPNLKKEDAKVVAKY